MAVYSEKFQISTLGFADAIDITSKIQSVISSFGLEDAILNISVSDPCSSIIKLRSETGLSKDLTEILEYLAPINRMYQHDNNWHEGNAHAQLKAAMLGGDVCVNIVNGQMQLDDWQRIVLIDFDTKASQKEISVCAVC